jgi:prepilin-type N-terminal cleavage/methylation domain-containing protein
MIEATVHNYMINIFSKKHKNEGFSLIEILVALSIIAILLGVVVASVSDAKAKARDSQRKIDLKQIQLALEKYANYNGTYKVSGSGARGLGDGYIGQEGESPYTSVSVMRALKNAGFLNQSVQDDLPQSPSGYMLHLCGVDKYALSATLEKPTSADISNIQTTCNGTGPDGAFTKYGKNYAISN